MDLSIPTHPPSPAHLAGRPTLFLSLVPFTVANVIHNRFGLDPAIVPATVLTGLVAPTGAPRRRS